MKLNKKRKVSKRKSKNVKRKTKGNTKKQKLTKNTNDSNALGKQFKMLHSPYNVVSELLNNDSNLFENKTKIKVARYMDDGDRQEKFIDFLEARETLHKERIKSSKQYDAKNKLLMEPKEEKEENLDHLTKKQIQFRKETNEFLHSASFKMRTNNGTNNFMLPLTPAHDYVEMTFGKAKHHKNSWIHFQPTGGRSKVPEIIYNIHRKYQSAILSNNFGEKAPNLIKELSKYDDLELLLDFTEPLSISTVNCKAVPFWVKDISCYKLYLIFTAEDYLIDFIYVKMN